MDVGTDLLMLNLPHPDNSDNFESDLDTFRTPDTGKVDNSLLDLAAARRYLAEKATMCARAANSSDPREVLLAVGVAQNRNGERTERGREVYSLECDSCKRAIEISTEPPHLCAFCGTNLRIQWDL
jgi:hypothetical protein